MPRSQPKSDLLQGTLDLLILQIAALGPVHGYAIAQRLTQVTRQALQVPQGIASNAAAGCEPSGAPPTAAAKRSSTS